jgi:hypothetical protein
MMNLRRATAFLVLVVLTLGTTAVAPAQDDGKPVILIEVKRHDFGEVYEQDKYRHDFKVKNTGTADLKIEKVKPG